MGIRSEFRKFEQHLKTGGILYAFYRGALYAAFLARKFRQRFNRHWEESISAGKTRVVFSRRGAKLAYADCEITRSSGLAAAIYSGGRWFNSDDAQWNILEKSRDTLTMRVKYFRLPVEQIWTIRLEEDQVISWRIDMSVQGTVHIEEICVSCFLSPHYKNWICNYTERDFPVFAARWQEVCVDDIPVSLLGVRLPLRDELLPSVLIELDELDGEMYPLVRSSPSQDAFRAIGVRSTLFKSLQDIPEGQYTIFSGKVCLHNDDSLLDDKMEVLRKRSLKTRLEEISSRKAGKRMKILLANLPWQKDGRWGVRAGSRWPHIKDEKESGYLPFPFFLSYAAAVLKKQGFQTVLVDAIAGQIPEYEFLEKYVLQGFDYLVAETSIPSFEDDMRLLNRISGFGISVILCGPNTEIFQPSFLERYPFISYVMFGEYEFTLLELLRSLEEKRDLSEVRGLIFRQAGKVIKNASRGHFPLDLLPWPDRDSLPMERYLDAPGEMRTPSVQMMASRGCPFRCQFCLWPQVMYQGHHYRVRNYIEVVDEMEYLVREKGFKSVYFDDDTFNVGRERMLALCREIRKRGLHKTQWAIMARPDLMDEELLVNFKKAGLYAVKYGVESSAQHLVNEIGKNMDLEKAGRMIRYSRKLGIKVHLTFTFGLPGENRGTIENTIAWVLKLDPFSVQFSLLTPFPGTEYYQSVEEKGWLVSGDFSSFDGQHSSVVRTEQLSSLDLEIAKSYAERVWLDHVRSKRGITGDVKRFFGFVQSRGFLYAVDKAARYLGYIALKRKKYLTLDRLIGRTPLLNPKSPRRQERTYQDPRDFMHMGNEGGADILLIQCPPWDVSMPPLGIAYLSSHLKKCGYTTLVFDLSVILYNSVRESSCFLWDQKSFDWWTDEALFRDTWSQLKALTENFIARVLQESSVPCIGLSASFASIRLVIELVKYIRARDGNIKIIVGGWGCSDEYMRSLYAQAPPDVFVAGEGERVITDVLEYLRGNKQEREIAGRVSKCGTALVVESESPVIDLDMIPWPTFSEFHLGLYKYAIIPLFGSRGCISRCAFCNDWLFSKPYRTHSARYIFEKIKYHVTHNNITIFSFKDLLCNGNMRQLEELCDLIIGSRLRITWDSQAIARREMTYAFLCKLKKSGCSSLVYGAESFSDNVLKRMGKLFTKEILEVVLRDTYRAGICPMVNLIAGFPGETEDDFRETMSFIEQNHKYIRRVGAVSVCLVNGHSPLDRDYEQYGIVLPEDHAIRAKKWFTKDGKNTYEIRRKRAERLVELLKRLRISYDTCTI